jgi:hypothetical protein
MPTPNDHGKADLIPEFERALEFVGTWAGHMVGGAAGVKPLTGQSIPVEREHAVEECLGLLHGQRATLAVDHDELIVHRVGRAGAHKRHGHE